VITSSSESDEALAWGEEVATRELIVILKPNIGHDFGSWSVALAMLPEIAHAARVVFANDSMAGPFGSLRSLLAQLESSDADVWGLTASRQFAPHLQSYFLVFCDGVLATPALQRFWARIRNENQKPRIVLRYEVGLSSLLREEGYILRPAFRHKLLMASDQNPVIIGWKGLLEQGFPFLKREIIRNPLVAPDGETAPAFVNRLLGVDVCDWVDDRPPRAAPAT
jgi:lipopolysaccharide biosynthesis protein